MPLSLPKLAERFEKELQAAVAKVDLSVLVMGPALPTSAGAADLAAELRAEIITQCRTYGASVYPEHKRLTRTAKRSLGAHHDLCTYEAHLVNTCDLLVIIPSSPGSFCELGYFGMLNDVCTKMIVLCDARFPKSGSYVADGPVRAATQRRALVRHVDYGNTAACWRIVKRAIEDKRASKTLENLS